MVTLLCRKQTQQPALLKQLKQLGQAQNINGGRIEMSCYYDWPSWWTMLSAARLNDGILLDSIEYERHPKAQAELDRAKQLLNERDSKTYAWGV